MYDFGIEFYKFMLRCGDTYQPGIQPFMIKTGGSCKNITKVKALGQDPGSSWWLFRCTFVRSLSTVKPSTVRARGSALSFWWATNYHNKPELLGHMALQGRALSRNGWLPLWEVGLNSMCHVVHVIMATWWHRVTVPLCHGHSLN